MLRPHLVQFRHAYDALRRIPILAIDALRRGLTGVFFVDNTLKERLSLVRSAERAVHYRRLPTKRPRRVRPATPSHLAKTPHQRAIKRLQLELTAGEGLTCVFHDGMCVLPGSVCLVREGDLVIVRVESSFSIGGRRLVPDVMIVSPATGRPLLAVEVCASYPVGTVKRAAYAHAGIPWVEVRALQVIGRFRKRPICAENWAGPQFPRPPSQLTLTLVGGVGARSPTHITLEQGHTSTRWREDYPDLVCM